MYSFNQWEKEMMAVMYRHTYTHESFIPLEKKESIQHKIKLFGNCLYEMEKLLCLELDKYELENEGENI